MRFDAGPAASMASRMPKEKRSKVLLCAAIIITAFQILESQLYYDYRRGATILCNGDG